MQTFLAKDESWSDEHALEIERQADSAIVRFGRTELEHGDVVQIWFRQRWRRGQVHLRSYKPHSTPMVRINDNRFVELTSRTRLRRRR